jgi:DNA-binding MarR family transcriptional regulator
MAQMLDRMVKDGVLFREQDTIDRRKMIFSLFNRAIEIMPQIRAIVKNGKAETFSGVEMKSFFDLLSRVEGNIRLNQL